jgi:putative ABC transport system permease protein
LLRFIHHVSGLLGALAADTKHGFRALRGAPSFLMLSVCVIGLGIGVNATMFTFVRATIFRSLPVRDADRLMYVYGRSGQSFDLTSFRQLVEPMSAGVTAHAAVDGILSAPGKTIRVAGTVAPSNYFEVLGVRTALGRVLSPEDDQSATTQKAIVLSHQLWVNQFGSDGAVIGAEVRLDDQFFVVAGIAERGFHGLSEPWNPSAFWVTPAQYYGPLYRGTERHLIVKTSDGIALQQLRLLLRQDESDRKAPAIYSVRAAAEVLTPFEPDDGAETVRVIAVLGMTIVSVVLIIAVVNTAGILIARNVSREREVAVKQALGASAGRIARQFLAEGITLGVLGAAMGLMISRVFVALYRWLSPYRFTVDPNADAQVLTFTFILAIVSGLLVGIGPAVLARRISIRSVLSSGPNAGASPNVTRRLRNVIVIPQIALSVGMLIIAATYVRELRDVEVRNLGYRVEDTLALRVSYWQTGATGSPQTEAARARSFFARALEHARRVPGVSASLTSMLPIAAPAKPLKLVAKGHNTSDVAAMPGAALSYVSEGYFDTMGVSRLAGRDFEQTDTETSRPVAIVSESLAGNLWPQDTSLGKFVSIYQTNKPSAQLEWLEVVGVVSEIRAVVAENTDRPVLYRPVRQIARPGPYPLDLVVRGSAQEHGALIRAVTESVQTSDPFAQVVMAAPMTQFVDELLYPRRATAWTLGISGSLGLLLASIGVYGVVSHSVAQRRRELGVMSALGASVSQIVAPLVFAAAKVGALASVAGIIVAYFGLVVTATWFGSAPRIDAFSFITVPLLMITIVAAACFIPSRRATRLAPLETLRQQ